MDIVRAGNLNLGRFRSPKTTEIPRHHVPMPVPIVTAIPTGTAVHFYRYLRWCASAKITAPHPT